MTTIQNRYLNYFIDNSLDIVILHAQANPNYLPKLLKVLAFNKDQLNSEEGLKHKLIDVINRNTRITPRQTYLFIVEAIFATTHGIRKLPQRLNSSTQNKTLMKTFLHLSIRFYMRGEFLVKRAYDRKHFKIVKLLIEQGKPFPPYLLQKAIINEQSDLARFLIEKGANPNDKCGWEHSPLYHACIREDFSLVEWMVGKGAILDLKDKEMRQFLCKHPKFTKIFIDNKVHIEHINARKKKGDTCLHKAVCLGDKALTQFLVDNGADIDAEDDHQENAFNMAFTGGYFDIARLLMEYEGESYEAAVDVKFYGHICHKEGSHSLGKRRVNYEGFPVFLACEKFKELACSFFKDQRKEICNLNLGLTEEDCGWFYDRFKEVVNNLKEDPEKLLEKDYEEEPLIFLTGWAEHIISVIIDDEISRSDCDVLGTDSGITIFSRNKKEKGILVECIKTLQRGGNSLLEEEASFYEKLEKNLDLQLRNAISLTKQEVGNCAWFAIQNSFINLGYLYFQKKKHLLHEEAERIAKELTQVWVDSHVIPKMKQLLLEKHQIKINF